ncbi:MAG: hypothetical protein WC878_03920 [Candidatus Paceibacterota bacterium]|jgi:hypothetical protein
MNENEPKNKEGELVTLMTPEEFEKHEAPENSENVQSAMKQIQEDLLVGVTDGKIEGSGEVTALEAAKVQSLCRGVGWKNATVARNYREGEGHYLTFDLNPDNS